MSSIIPKPKRKNIEGDHYSFTFNFQNVNIHIATIVFFIISLLISYIYYDDKYYQFNQLPENRNEIMPINSINLSVNDECVIKAEFVIKYISKQTFTNLYQNINIKISGNNIGQSSIISVDNSDSVSSSSHCFCFYKKLTEYHNFAAQTRLFNEPIGEKYIFSC